MGEVERRRLGFGSNAREKKPLRTVWQILCAVLDDFMLRILLVAAVVTIIVNMIVEEEKSTGSFFLLVIAWIDGVAIFFAVLVVCLVTTINDYKKERQFERLNETAESEKRVNCIREGQEMEDVQIGDTVEKHPKRTHIDDLVVGDIVRIETGKTIPADAILIEGKDIEMDEAAVTGESNTMKKVPYEECLTKIEHVKAHHAEDLNKHTAVPSPVLLSGTKVFKGTGLYMVIVVGKISFMGELKESMEGDQEETPLQQKLTALSEDIGKLGLIAAIATVLVMFISYFIIRGKDGGWEKDDVGLCFSYLVLGITVLVVAIPEGLPLAVTIAMAYSVMKMYQENNFVKTLAACETMGEVNNICTDKTGTLTKNLMTVLEVWVGEKPYNVEADRAVLSNEAPKEAVDALFEVLACNTNVEDANATEMGFLKFLEASQYDYNGIRKRLMPDSHSYDRILFTSSRKKSSTLLKKDGTDWLYTFGNVMKILESCSKVFNREGKEVALTEDIKRDLLDDITKANTRALRTLGVALKRLAPGECGEDHLDTIKDETYAVEEGGLTFIGYLGLRDQLRDRVLEAVTILTKKAGVTVRMVTGDNYETAVAIAKECGIIDQSATGTEKDVAMTGFDFYERVGGKTWLCKKCEDEKSKNQKVAVEEDKQELVLDIDSKKESEEKMCPTCKVKLEVTAKNMKEFTKITESLRVISSCRPGDKYLLVAGLRYMGNIVGVTGDGSNDAPALKKADIGLAMNAGTDLAKDAAGIVLLDNNFASIQTAVNWGRNIFDSIRKFVQFQLSVNIVALVLAFVGAAIISESPLTAIQLLWVNLIMDSLASLALATDSPTMDQLERPPVKKDEYIITKVVSHSSIEDDEEYNRAVGVHGGGSFGDFDGGGVLHPRGLPHEGGQRPPGPHCTFP